jgi:hypothetical protein
MIPNLGSLYNRACMAVSGSTKSRVVSRKNALYICSKT